MNSMSASRLDTYLRCPALYKYRYVDQIEVEEKSPALALGTAVHRSIAHWYRTLLEGDPSGIGDVFMEEWAAATAVPLNWNGKSSSDLEAQGLAMVQAYVDANPEPQVPLAVEERFTVPIVNPLTDHILEGVEFVGYVDRIGPDNEIIEVKTSARRWSPLQARQSVQMSAYCYMVAFITGWDTARGRFEIITKTKAPAVQVLPATRGPADFARFCDLVGDVVRSVDVGLFYPRPGFLCSGCDYLALCQGDGDGDSET